MKIKELLFHIIVGYYCPYLGKIACSYEQEKLKTGFLPISSVSLRLGFALLKVKFILLSGR